MNKTLSSPIPTLFPYTTLFRSRDALGHSYRELHDRLGLTTLMVKHDIAEALLLADRVVVLIGGRIRAEDRKSTRLNSSHSQNSYPVFCLKKKTAICGCHFLNPG